MANKLFSKNRKQINKSKWKINIEKTSLRKSIISSLINFDKKKLQVPILAIKKSDPKAKIIDIAMIDADIYSIACYLNRA